MFTILKRLASYLSMLETDLWEEALVAMDEVLLDAAIYIWSQHDYDEDETALLRYPIYVEACAVSEFCGC